MFLSYCKIKLLDLLLAPLVPQNIKLTTNKPPKSNQIEIKDKVCDPELSNNPGLKTVAYMEDMEIFWSNSLEVSCHWHKSLSFLVEDAQLHWTYICTFFFLIRSYVECYFFFLNGTMDTAPFCPIELCQLVWSTNSNLMLHVAYEDIYLKLDRSCHWINLSYSTSTKYLSIYLHVFKQLVKCNIFESGE